VTVIDRRQALISAAGLAGSLLASVGLVAGVRAQGFDDHDDEDPGYDLLTDESHPTSTRKIKGGPPPPPSFVVNPEFLPPVGAQGTVGSCVSWASGYGLATYMLARRDKKDPANPANQVSPAFLYSSVRNAKASGCDSANDVLQDHCDGKKSSSLGKGGTNISMTLAILRKWGAVSVAECPYPNIVSAGRNVVSGALYDSVYTAWGATRAQPSMKIGISHAHVMRWEQSSSLHEMKVVLAQNEPLVYGTRLPANWKSARFEPGRPWEHYRVMHRKSNGTLAGHAMLIIGYDDEMQSAGGSRGAVLLQNSWGTDWGMTWAEAFKRHYPSLPERQGRGYAWITYEAFRALASGSNKDPTEGLVFSIEV
jgi:hypothetical protein